MEEKGKEGKGRGGRGKLGAGNVLEKEEEKNQTVGRWKGQDCKLCDDNARVSITNSLDKEMG